MDTSGREPFLRYLVVLQLLFQDEIRTSSFMFNMVVTHTIIWTQFVTCLWNILRVLFMPNQVTLKCWGYYKYSKPRKSHARTGWWRVSEKCSMVLLAQLWLFFVHLNSVNFASISVVMLWHLRCIWAMTYTDHFASFSMVILLHLRCHWPMTCTNTDAPPYSCCGASASSAFSLSGFTGNGHYGRDKKRTKLRIRP